MKLFFLLFNFVGHYCLDVDFTSNFFIHPNHDVIPFKYDIHYGFEVVEGINYESIVKEVILKSRFFDIDNKRWKNINKGDQKVSKHIKL
jgi:hypothetical protein